MKEKAKIVSKIAGQIQKEVFCETDTNEILTDFILLILVPTFFIRLFGHLRFRNRDHLEFKDCSTYISVFYNGAYGVWTILNMNQFFGATQACRQVRSLSMLNYQVTIVFGIFPAVNVIGVFVFMLIFIPLYLYSLWN